MSNPIIVQDVSKKFKIYHDKPTTLKERLLFIKKNSWEEFWALKNVSIDIKKGSTVGLIGQNGSGKSTLLKLMTRIIYPTSGEIITSGRVSSLLELGAGFHPDFTGRENIYTNASIFGLSKKEIDRRIEKIIDFSELGEFIDNPIRTYSSGMYMRLAFSVAINVDPEILLIDEILAVGDASFQKKCMDKLADFKKNGATIIIVSHDLGSIKRLCSEVVWLDKGKIVKQGEPYDVVASYLDYMGDNQASQHRKHEEENPIIAEGVSQDNELVSDMKRWGNKDIIIEKVEMLDVNGKMSTAFKTNEEITIKISYVRKDKTIKSPVFGIGIFRNDGLNCYGTNTFIDREKNIVLNDKGIVYCSINAMSLLEGQYLLDVAVESADGFPYDYIRNVYHFKMFADSQEVGVCSLTHKWRFE